MKKKHAHAPVLLALRQAGLAYPGAHTKAPWPGHLDLAVNDKTFAYLSLEHEPLHVSCKLPRSAGLALTMPNVTPTAYGLGKSGWVTATFTDGDKPPLQLLLQWLDESYRAQAPKKHLAQLAPADSKPAKPAKAKPAKAKPAAAKRR